MQRPPAPVRIRTGHHLTGVVALVLAVTTGLVTWAAPAAASVEVTDRETLLPGLEFARIQTVLASGETARGTMVRFDPGDPMLTLRTVPAGGGLAGLAPVPSIAERSPTAVAAINGGFWVDPPDGAPTGRPHGVSVLDGSLRTGPRTLWGVPGNRGTMGVTPDARVVFSRLAGAVTVTRPDGTVIPVDELNTEFLNRRGWDEQILLYTPAYPTAVTVPAGGVALTLADLDLRPNTVATPTVAAVTGGGGDGVQLPVPEGGGLLVAQPAVADSLSGIPVGEAVSIQPGILALDGDPDVWAQVAQALPAGPYIVSEGVRTRSAQWIEEGFSHERHNGPRVSRSGIGVTAGGEVMLVTVDGRQPGWSPGMNMWEFANLLIDLGAVEALSLDGGGSTTSVVLGEVRNRPSNGFLRSVANALVVEHSYPLAHSQRLAGANRYGTAAAIALAAHPDGADQVVLARGRDFPDALAGGPLAHQLGAPLLLTDTAVLPDVTAQALAALGASRVRVLGGPAAVSKEVVDDLRARGLTVDRLSGADRAATASAIAQALPGDPRRDTVVLASGRTFADALVAAAPAGRLGAPILLTDPQQLPAATVEYLRALTPTEIVIVGGEQVVGPEVERSLAELAPLTAVRRLAGPDRYATAEKIATWAVDTIGLGTEVVVARGDEFPDALAGGPFAAGRGALLMIVPPGDPLAETAASTTWLRTHRGPLELVHLLGGQAVLPLYDRLRLDQLVEEEALPAPAG